MNLIIEPCQGVIEPFWGHKIKHPPTPFIESPPTCYTDSENEPSKALVGDHGSKFSAALTEIQSVALGPLSSLVEYAPPPKPYI